MEKRGCVQTKFCVGDVCNMMTAPKDGEERLAEIFREIFALSETNQSKSTSADDSVKLFDTGRTSGTSHTPNEKQVFDPSNPTDDQELHR